MSPAGRCVLSCCTVFVIVTLLVYSASVQRMGHPPSVLRAPAPINKLGAKLRTDPSLEHKKTREVAPCNNQSCWETEQSHRKGIARETCNALRGADTNHQPSVVYRLDQPGRKTTRASALKHFIVIDSLKLIYCFIPKVSCTSWKRLFLVMSGKYPSMEGIGQKEAHILALKTFRTMASYTVAEAEKLLSTYRTFVFVRNPYERVLSAYQDKFQEDYPASRAARTQHSKRIIQMTGGSPENVQKLMRSQLRKDGTLNVTFSQFVRYVSNLSHPETRNVHWKPMYLICYPCLVDYDWIGHYGSLQTDAEFILRAVGADPKFRFPNFTTNPTGSSSGDTLHRYYSTLTNEEIKMLHKFYELDFSLFGFEIPSSIQSLLNNRGRAQDYASNNQLSHLSHRPTT